MREVKKLIKQNEWLNGMADFREGDIGALLEADRFLDFIPCTTPRELYENLKNYSGSFQYKNLIFANHHLYGCFVFKESEDKAEEVEHLTMDVISLDKFIEILNRLEREV